MIVKKNTIIFFIIAIILGVFLVNPERYANAFFDGVVVWTKNILPTMFPYLFLSKILIDLNCLDFISNKTAPVISRIFNAPKSSSNVFIVSLLCGYPIGAKLTNDLYDKGLVTTNNCYKIATFCSTASPVYIIATIGAKLFKNFDCAIIILVSHLLSTILNGIIFKNKFVDTFSPLIKPNKETNVLSNAMYSSLLSILSICGFVAFFYMICDMITSFLPLTFMLNNRVLIAVIFGIIEMTNGCNSLSTLPIGILPTVLCAGIVSFGGLCIFLQSMAYYKNCHLNGGKILFFKIVQSFSAMLICLILCLLIM